MDELRSWWEVPSIAHFCSLFRTAFELTDFDIEDLEDALLESQREEGSEFVTDLVCKLLNGCYCRKDVTILNYDLYVKDVIKYKWDGTGNPILEKSEFKQLSLREKVELIHAICEYRLDGEDIPELLKGYEGDNMRVEPLGKDKDGGTYWYFYGSRLYKEDPPPKKEVSREEKRAKERQRKKELEKQRKTEKKQKKIEKRKEKALRRAEKIAKASKPVVEPEDDGNIRRSGRLRIKKELQKVISESSESSSSEEESDESSCSDNDQEHETEDGEPEPEKPTKQKNCKKTPAKKTPARKTPAKKTPSKNQNNDTPSSTPRQSGRLKGKAKSKTSRNTTVEQKPELDSGIRRSGRIQRRKQSIVSASQRNDSDSEEEVKDEVDSGHESGVTDDDDDTKSETSKLSVKSTMSKSSQQATPVARRITLPRASAHMEKRYAIGEENEDSENEKTDAEEQAPDEESQDKEEDAEKDEKCELNVSEKDQENIELCKSETQKGETDSCMAVENSDGKEKEQNKSNVDHGQLRNTESSSQDIIVENENPNDLDSVPDNCPPEDSNKATDDVMEVEDSETSESIVINDQNSSLENRTRVEDLSVKNDSAMEEKPCEGESNSIDEKISSEQESKASGDLKCSDKDVTTDVQNGANNNETPDLTGEIKSDITQKVEHGQCEIKDESTAPLNDKPSENSGVNCKEVSEKILEPDENQINDKNENQIDDKTDQMKYDSSEETMKAVSEHVIKDELINDKGDTLKDVEEENIVDKNECIDVKVDEIKAEPNCEEEQDEDDKEMKEKETNVSGPKTTLGKQKAFTSGPVEPSKSNTRWHLICSTLDDWVNLAEWFSDSQSRCEKMLLKLIKEDFLPVLPEIIEAREKERRKRLQELEVRRSNRITHKMKEKMEQEKILAEALALEEKEKLRAEEDRRLKEEQQRLEEENRLREERVKAREERAKRLSMREERARLIAEGKEIPPELLYTATNKYNDDYESDDSRSDLKTEEDYNNLIRLVEAMKVHKDSWPFLEAVTDEVAPGYSEVIKRPMDLSKIEEKVKKRDYKSTQHFLSDFRLMFNNCKRFNGPDNEFTECARSMEQMLKKYRKKFLLDQPVENSYYHDKDFTLKGSKSGENVKGSKSGDKRYRPRRAASSRAMETVHKALNSSDEESDDEEEEEEESPPKRRKPAEFPAKQPSHQSLLLQEMIQMKRQREKSLASKILQNNQVVTRGPERIRVGNPQEGVTIMPRDELPTQGLLKLAASREIKRKVNPQFGEMVDLTKKDPGLSVTSNTVGPGRGRGKTIKIVAPSGAGPSGSVLRDTAGTVTVSADGYLIIGGRNSGIKVSQNTRIVIQPPGASQNQSNTNSPSQGTELLVKRIPTPSGLKALPDSSSGIEKNTNPAVKDCSSVKPDAPRTPAILSASNSAPFYQSKGNVPTVVRQHQFLNRELNSSGVVTQNPNSLSSNLINRPLNSTLFSRKQDTLAKGHQQQNGAELQSTPAKVRKLSTSQESAVTSPSHMSIEERLREPNIDRVSENVVKSVNIAGDILDSYYSVLNSAKSNKGETPSPKPVETQTTPKHVGTANKHYVSQDIKSRLLQTVVNNKVLGNAASSVLNVNKSRESITHPVSQISQRTVNTFNTHQTMPTNLISQSPANSTISSNPIANMNSQAQVTNMQMNTEKGGPHGSYLQNTSHNVSQHGYTASLARPKSSTSMSPIEALLTRNTPSNVSANPYHRSNDQLIQQSPVSTPISLAFPTIRTEISKPSNLIPRQNLFDMFESSEKQVVASDNSSGNSRPENQQGTIPGLPSAELMKDIREPVSGTINYGSPLKTSSIMEALKFKLSQPLKQEHQASQPKSATYMDFHQISHDQHWSSQTSILHPEFPHVATVSMKSTNSVGNTPVFIPKNEQTIYSNVPVVMRGPGVNLITSQHLSYGQPTQQVQVPANYGQTAQQVQNSDSLPEQSFHLIAALPPSSTMNNQVMSSNCNLSSTLDSQQFVRHETKDHTS